MSWLGSSEATSRDLARLLVHGGGVHPGELDTALTARAAVLDVTAAVHQGLTGGASGTARVADLDADPVRLLGRLLVDQPRPATTTSVTDALAGPAATAVGGLWRDVARHAVIAGSDWDGADPTTRPAGARAWTAVAATAALAEAVGRLDADLAASAVTAGREKDAELLTRGAWSGLSGTAAAVRALAERGDLPAPGDVAPAPSRGVVPVRTLADLPAATDRLAHLLATTKAISPRDVQQVVRAHARTTMAAAALLVATLPHPAPPQRLAVVESLVEHAHTLRAAGDRPRRTESVFPSDHRPLAQATEVARYLALAGAGASTGTASPGRDAAVLVEYARAAAGVSAALARTARRQVQAHRWLVPPGEDSRSRLVWTRTTPETPAPPLLTALDKAGDHGRALAAAAAAAGWSRGADQGAVAARGMPGTEALTAALAAARAAQGRPSSPAAAVGYRPPAGSLGRSRESPSR
jgi:hypothetical protein